MDEYGNLRDTEIFRSSENIPEKAQVLVFDSFVKSKITGTK